MNQKAYNILKLALIMFGLSILFWTQIVQNNVLQTILEAQKPISRLNQVDVMRVVNNWKGRDYKSNYALCGLADARINDIQTDYSHNGFGDKALDVIATTDLDQVGEILGSNFASADQLMTAWVNSPAHLAELEMEYPYACTRCLGNYCAVEFGK